MVVKHQQAERAFHAAEPKVCHIMVITGIEKMNRGKWKTAKTAPDLERRLIVTVTVCSGKACQIQSCEVPPGTEALFLIGLRK